VLGRVAQAGGPAQTSDYASDSALVHDDEVDRIVAAEGVQAILGAPMRSNGQVIGALLAANRFVREFSAEQVYIAQTLANLAAVAIDNMDEVAVLETGIEVLRASHRETEAELVTER